MSELKSTIISIAIYRDGVNPVFGDTVITISVDDEGDGPFLVMGSNLEGDKLRIDLDELELAAVEGRKLIEQFEGEDKGDV